METSINPFNITKAVDYSDIQINDLWVDLPIGGFSEIVKPTSPMPMLILGGKGSGKTHIMKYYSYNLQKLRYEKSEDGLMKSLQRDKYLGLYMRCGGLNSGRFTKKGLDEDQWKTLFGYYLEIWLSQLVLTAVNDVIVNRIDLDNEERLVKKILQLFDTDLEESITTLTELINFIKSVQRKIDFEINNLGLLRRGEVNKNLSVIVSPGNLIFGLPRLIKQEIYFFKEFTFLYLIDEFENLELYQQKYFNTLIREREFPTTFKVGARLFGIKTFKTFSGEEEIREGSEYELVNIDNILRESKDYYNYIQTICLKRLHSSGYETNNKNFREYFENFNLDNFFYDLVSKGQRKYFAPFKSNLKQTKISEKVIEQIVENLTFSESLIIERTNIFLFYRELKGNEANKSSRLMLSISEKIASDALKYNAGSKETMHYIVLSKYKTDIVDQIFREYNLNLPYYGFDNLVKMSSGIPRVLLKALKEIYKQSFFNGESPFKKGLISLSSQYKGLIASSSWFVEDAVPPSNKKVGIALQRIGTFLQELRFSDNPPECSICIFSINYSYLDPTTKLVIDTLKNYSLIIRVNSRRDKNGNSIGETYQVNGIIAPIWELAISRRGTVNLSRFEIETIFGEKSELFKESLNLRLRSCNFPFNGSSEVLPLFSNVK